jgi:hypothetical protein
MRTGIGVLFVVVVGIFLSTGVAARAQSGGGYEITSSTIDGGGGVSSGGGYTLVGTIGQPDTGVTSGGEYVLSAGFHPGSFGCVVNLTDLLIFVDWWLEDGPGMPADIDGDDDVDMEDFAALAYSWYDMCPADWPLK